MNDRAKYKGRMAIYAMAGVYLLAQAYYMYKDIPTSSGTDKTLMSIFMVVFAVIGAGMVIMGVTKSYKAIKEDYYATPEEARNAQSGKFTVSVGSASGKDGDEVKVPINFSDNPGLVGMIFWFEYDSNALELVPDECGVGADAADYITFQGN